MSVTSTTITASPTFDDFLPSRQKLVLNVEMSFLREQLVSQSTRSRTLPSREAVGNAANKKQPRCHLQPPKKRIKKVPVNKPVFRRVHPLDIFFKAENARKKFDEEKKYKPWDYYVDKDVEEEHNREIVISSSSIKSKTLFPDIGEVREDRNVSFDVAEEANLPYNKLPGISPDSREMSAVSRTMANECDVTFYSKTPPNKKRKDTKKGKISNERDTDVFNISFRPNSRGDYDPNSELRSSYYTIKRLDTTTIPRVDSRPRNLLGSRNLTQSTITIPARQKPTSFHALLVGTQKLLHRKNKIECDGGYRSVPIENWTQSKVNNYPGYSSVPLQRY